MPVTPKPLYIWNAHAPRPVSTMATRKPTQSAQPMEMRSSGRSRSDVRRSSVTFMRLSEILNLRQRAKVLEQFAAARRLEQPRHFAFRIVEVAEHQRLRWARLGAGCGELAVLQLTLVGSRRDLRRRDALRAEGALLHH